MKLVECGVLDELRKGMIEAGWGLDTEPYGICDKALEMLGWGYQQSEELVRESAIDCSTLVSQSHWEGAAIGVPFVAENQRTAVSGLNIRRIEDAIPSDVLVKYRSLDESPEGRWNHVGLYLGADFRGERWVIEAAGGQGVQLSTVKAFRPEGGIKRFTLSWSVFDSLEARQALALTRLVPKLGRLGARQYRRSSAERIPHRGLDLYTEPGAYVHATLDGTISLEWDPIEQFNGVAIVGSRYIVRVFPLGEIMVSAGTPVKKGDMIGRLVPPSETSDIRYATFPHGSSHLHLEVECRFAGAIERQRIVVDGKKYLNHLYLSKTGELGIPLADGPTM